MNRPNHETALPTDVRLTIPRVLRCQPALQVRIARRHVRISTKTVPKCEVLPPQVTALLHEMDVIRTRLPATKELMPDDARIAAMLIARLLERGDVVANRYTRGVASQDVEDRLGAQAPYGRAADVLQSQRQLRNCSQNSGRL